jgi:hypothetical protein
VQAVVTAGAGFLLAVLWFDLMFDVQGPSGVDSTAAYYARVTTGAAPMNRLVMAMMVVTLAGIVAEIAGDDVERWAAWPSLLLAAAPIAVAGSKTVPRAVRLGARTDDAATRQAMAAAIRREHVACFVSIAALVALQLASVAID